MAHGLISADSHVNPPPTMWVDSLQSAFRDRAPRIESTDEGDFRVFEERRTPILGIGAKAGKKPEDYRWSIRRLGDQRAGGFDPNERLVDMDTDHVRAEVLYGGRPLPCEDRELRRASYGACNNWLADFCSVAPNRLLGMAYIPCDPPESAIAEVKRCAARGAA